MKQEIVFLFEMIKSLLNDSKIETSSIQQEIDWKWLFSFAKKHGIQNLLCYGIEKLPDEYKPSKEDICFLEQQVMQVVATSVYQMEATKEIEEAFDKEGIHLLAVKGICTKNKYPQPEMRTMGDIDLLYQASQTKMMQTVLKGLGYGDGEEGRKHDSFFCPPYINIEMHRELLAADSKYYSYYADIWERVQLKEGYQSVYQMSLEDEYIYTLLHLVEHFQNGGIGIRFVMDIYIYNHLENMSWDYVEAELQKLELLEFYKNISSLAEKWFGKEQPQGVENTLIQEMETYILSNGIFGTSRNAAATAVAKSGRLRFLMRTVFPNLENMKTMFPWLEKWPSLLLYSWILRGVRSVLFRRKNILVQLKKYAFGDEAYGETLKQFFGKCGL